MSLQTRLAALITAVGADIKSINTQLSSLASPRTTKQTFQAGIVLDTAPGDDNNNGVYSHLLIKPSDTNVNANAITIKRTSHSGTGWGNASVPYGAGQVIELLDDSATAASASTDPTNPALFRLDSFGGLGTGQGMHVATGLRRQGDTAAPSQGIWINPYIDAVGLVIDNPAVADLAATPVMSYIACRDVRAATLYDPFEVQADGTVQHRKATVLTANVIADVILTLKKLTGGTGEVLRAERPDGTKALAFNANAASMGFEAWSSDGTSTAVVSFYSGDTTPFGARVMIQAGSSGTIGLWLKAAATPTVDMVEVLDSTNALLFRINKNGHTVIKKTAAPVLADLTDGEWTSRVDTANNRIQFYARIGGVLKVANVTVA